MSTRTNNEFLATSAIAANDLAAAQAKRAELETKASQRLAKAQERHTSDLNEARRVEAEAWKQLMAVPGMTAATAAQIGRTTTIKVSRWISGGGQDAPCS
ncbi:MAG: hypothetical protein Q8M73_11155 [Actinomycetota bacterium]|nr:hypothetical protein [Actinomycetota bacterium]